jgi:uncharacterized protein (DUF302 family)
MTNLGFRINLGATTVEDARGVVTEALSSEGFGVLTEIDVQATLKKKLDADTSPYLILGACNPSLAKRALEAEPDVGLLLPCNVVVRAIPTGVEVHIADPKVMFRLVDVPDLAPIADEAEARLRRVAATLSTKAPS